MSWTLLGSQGRYRLSTTIASICTCFITLPLSALLSVHFNVNLQGQTAAYVFGYLVAGTVQTYYLLRSNWDELASTVMEHNETELLVGPPSSLNMLEESSPSDEMKPNGETEEQSEFSNAEASAG